MRSYTRVLSFLACALVIGAVWKLTRSDEHGARRLFAGIQARIESGHYDPEASLASLDLALSGARESVDEALAVDVQLTRGHLLMMLGAHDRARADLEIVARARPDDLQIQYDLIAIDREIGDFQRALARVDTLLTGDATRVQSWIAKANLHRQAGDHAVTEAVHALDAVLVTEDLDAARELLRTSATLDTTDPMRVALGSRLRALLSADDEGLLGRVLTLVDRAAVDMGSARTAYVRALEQGFEIEALAGLCELFARAGRDSEAAELLASVMRLDRVRSDSRIVRLTIAVLARLERFAFAAEIASTWLRSQTLADPALLLEACEVLRRAHRPAELEIAAQRVVGSGNADEVAHGRCYLGLAWLEQLPSSNAGRARAARFLQARFQLGKFISAKGAEPFAGALARAYRAMAAGAELCQDPSEREMLETYLGLEPEADGNAWLRLAELELAAKNTGYRLPETHFARGLRLLPERAEELLPRWRELGLRELASTGIDLDTVRAEILSKRTWKPSSDASPFELYSLAEVHLLANDTLRAASYVDDLLTALPGFAPALDLMIDITARTGRDREFRSAVLARAALKGRSLTIITALRGLRLEELSSTDLLSLMRADPEYTGRLVLASGLVARGHSSDAMASLEAMDLASLGDTGQVLLARVDLAAGRAGSAAQRLESVASSLPAYADGAELVTRALLAADDRKGLTEHMRRLAQTAPSPTDRARWLTLIDELLSGGANDAALVLLESLDGVKALREGDSLVRLAAAQLAQGEFDDAALSIDRAQAFDTLGLADRLAAFSAIGEDRFDDLKALLPEVPAKRTRENAAPSAPTFDEVLLATLTERPGDTRLFLDDAQRRSDTDESLVTAFEACLAERGSSTFRAPASYGASGTGEFMAFAHGIDGNADTRRALGVLLALQHAVTVPIARAWLEAWIRDGSHGYLVPRWFLCVLTSRAAPNAPRTWLDAILTERSDFVPAWDLLERLELGPSADEAHIAALRLRRFQALGDRSGTSAELAIDRARDYARKEAWEEAELEARAALVADPGSWVALSLLGAILDRTERYWEALVAQRDACHLAVGTATDPSVGQRLVRATLATLEHARGSASAGIAPARSGAVLEDLAQLMPGDPWIVLELALHDLARDERNPSLGIARAYARLDRFSADTGGLALERLGPGAGAAWAAFYREIDPQRGLEFVAEQLALDPSVLELWIERARLLARTGDRAGAQHELELVERMCSTDAVALARMRLAIAGELDPEAIDTWTQRAFAADTAGRFGTEIMLAQIRAHANRGPRAQDTVLTLVDAVNQDRLTSVEARLEYAILNCVAHLTRGLYADREPVEQLAARAETLTVDPFRRASLQAIRGLVRHTTPARRTEPAPKPAPKTARDG